MKSKFNIHKWAPTISSLCTTLVFVITLGNKFHQYVIKQIPLNAILIGIIEILSLIILFLIVRAILYFMSNFKKKKFLKNLSSKEKQLLNKFKAKIKLSIGPNHRDIVNNFAKHKIVFYVPEDNLFIMDEFVLKYLNKHDL